jgi:predicted metal-binding membrane protein
VTLAARSRGRTSLERGQLSLLVLLALLTAGAWALTVHQTRTMERPMGVVAQPVDSAPGMAGMAMPGMAGMTDAGWTWAGFAAFLTAWSAMMAAMMFPAAAPMLIVFRRMAGGRGPRAAARTWIFAAGYLLVWSAIGALAWALVRLSSEAAGRVTAAERAEWGPRALGATLAVAGLYQFAPWKGACLRQCQSPVGFVMSHWRDGRRGAVRMGAVHGLYCLGCCWALFAVLVATGVMSLAWMLLLTVVVFAEKALPVGRWGPRAVGVAFLALGTAVAVGAIGMPWVA